MRDLAASSKGTIGALALAGASALASCSSPPPTYADIRITGVLVGPPISGLQWDLARAHAAHFTTDLTTALASDDPYAATSAVMTAFQADLGSTVDAPDPVLEATLFVNDAPAGTIPLTTDANADTFFASFANVSWDRVPLDAQLRIEIDVTDVDPPDYEPICVAEIDTADIVAARDAEEVTHVDVSMQCENELLFVDLVVTQVD